MSDETFETRVVAWLAGELSGVEADAVKAELSDPARARVAEPLIAAWLGALPIARADTRRAWINLKLRIVTAEGGTASRSSLVND